MVQMNKDERVWVCFELARVQTVHAVQDCGPIVGFLPSLRYSRMTENTGSVAQA